MYLWQYLSHYWPSQTVYVAFLPEWMLFILCTVFFLAQSLHLGIKIISRIFLLKENNNKRLFLTSTGVFKNIMKFKAYLTENEIH